MRSIKKYWTAVELDVKTTHVLEVATATEGSTPINRKKGEKMSPPPMPTKPARMPVVTPMPSYSATSRQLQPSFATQRRL